MKKSRFFRALRDFTAIVVFGCLFSIIGYATGLRANQNRADAASSEKVVAESTLRQCEKAVWEYMKEKVKCVDHLAACAKAVQEYEQIMLREMSE